MIIIPANIFAAVDVAAIKSYQHKISANRNRADSLKQLIEAGERRIDRLGEDERNNLRQLHEMESNMVLANHLLDELNRQSNQVARDMISAKRATDSVNVQLSVRQQIMEERLRQIHKTGKISFPALLLGASTPTEFLNRVRFAAELNRYDRQIMAKISQEKTRRNTELSLLQIQNQQYTKLKTEKESESVLLTTQKQDREKLLASIRSEKSTWIAQLEKLRTAQRKLNSIVDELIRQRDASTVQVAKNLNVGFAKLKGSMIWPITGKIISRYGKQTHPVYGTVITNKGIGIAGTAGQLVKAAATGVVEYAGTLPGYGKVIILNHSDNYMTIYAHLGSVYLSKGSEITAGGNIGTIGAAHGITSEELHFEIRHKAETENPMEWLK